MNVEKKEMIMNLVDEIIKLESTQEYEDALDFYRKLFHIVFEEEYKTTLEYQKRL